MAQYEGCYPQCLDRRDSDCAHLGDDEKRQDDTEAVGLWKAKVGVHEV